MFRRLDTSQDGKLQISELKAGLDELKEFFQYQEIDYEDLLKAMDSDGDGEIDFTEFISAAFDKRALLTQANLDAAFKTFDIDGNGKITKEELKAVFAAGHASSATNEAWESIMNDVDKNGDGEIDYQEFTEVMKAVLGTGAKERASFHKK
jgi:calcium-dependent protein kinase